MFKFQIDWFFDKLGYMPKIDANWSFPVVPKATTVAQKPTVKKATTRKKKA